MNYDITERLIDKIASAHIAMLSAVGALLGVIVSATSIIASVGGSTSVLLFPTIVISFAGMACVLAAFHQEKKEFLKMFETMENIENLSRAEQTRKIKEEAGRRSPTNRLTRTALAITVFASFLFLTLCAQTFFTSHLKIS